MRYDNVTVTKGAGADPQAERRREAREAVGKVRTAALPAGSLDAIESLVQRAGSIGRAELRGAVARALAELLRPLQGALAIAQESGSPRYILGAVREMRATLQAIAHVADGGTDQRPAVIVLPPGSEPILAVEAESREVDE